MIDCKPEYVDKFLEAAKSRIGCLYVWPNESNNYSGKDLKFAKYKRVYDCSGLVTASLYEVLPDVDWRGAYNAKSLLGVCKNIDIESAKPGDLCFYGQSLSKVNHVAIYLGVKVLSASSGTSKTLTPDIARATNANVRIERSHLYRQDFLRAGRLFSCLDDG